MINVPDKSCFQSKLQGLRLFVLEHLILSRKTFMVAQLSGIDLSRKNQN